MFVLFKNKVINSYAINMLGSVYFESSQSTLSKDLDQLNA